MARPIIAKRLVEIAKKEGATAICHGATGKGNDQVRFELTIKALAPEMKIIAPWRLDTWKMQSREDEMQYLADHGIPFEAGHDNSYSRDRNLWHLSHEGLELEDPANEPNYEHILQMSVTPEKAPDQPEYVTLDFEKGIPVAVNEGTLCKSATVPAAVILDESAHDATASANVGRRCEGEISQKTCRNQINILLITFGS